MRYLLCTDRSTTVDPRRLWSPIGPPSTTTDTLGQRSLNSFRGKTQQRYHQVQIEYKHIEKEKNIPLLLILDSDTSNLKMRKKYISCVVNLPKSLSMSYITSFLRVYTYIYSHSATVRADVSAGKCKRFPAHLAETPHEGMIWDTDAYKLRGTKPCKQQMFNVHL